MRGEQFTIKSREALVEAQEHAEREEHPEVYPLHLARALVTQEGGVSAPILKKLGIDPERVLRDLDRELGRLPRARGGDVSLSPGIKTLIQKAQKEADEMRDEYVSTEHLLLGVIESGGEAAKIFRALGATRDSVLEALEAVRGSQRVTDQNPEGKYQALEKYTRDLTREAEKGKLDPVIGRDEEIRRSLQVLSRRRKNNPVLIGDPGVGKTAIVEGIAQRIAAGDVPRA